MNKTIFLTGIVLGGTAVMIGAFGAHSLKDLLNDQSLDTFRTANTYQMYQAFFFLFLSMVKKIDARSLTKVYWLMITGLVFFSGSLYFLALKELHGLDISIFGIITPIGGVFMIAAWLFLGVYGYSQLKGNIDKNKI